MNIPSLAEIFLPHDVAQVAEEPQDVQDRASGQLALCLHYPMLAWPRRWGGTGRPESRSRFQWQQ